MSSRAHIFSILIIGGCLGVAACGSATAPGAPAANVVQASPVDEREAVLAAITERCGLPRTALQFHGDAVAIQPAPDARYEAVDCMLREITARGLTSNMAIGFVGNEVPKGNNVRQAESGRVR